MNEVWYVLKVVVITVGLIFVMQVKVEDTTIEDHAMNWIHTSFISDWVQEASQGARSIVNKTYNSLFSNAEGVKSKSSDRTGVFKLNRSEKASASQVSDE